MASSHLAHVGAELEAVAVERLPQRPSRFQNLPAAQERERGLRPGERGCAQQRADLTSETPAVDEHEALAQLRELVAELKRHATAERVADEGGALMPEREQDVADTARVGTERVVAPRLRRLAVSEQVGRDHGEALGKPRHDV